MKNTKVVESYTPFTSVGSLSKLKKESLRESFLIDHFLENPIASKVWLDYPFEVGEWIEVGKCKTLSELMWKISQGFKLMYENWENYGTCYRGIDDLYIEVVIIYSDGRVGISIGS